MAEEPIGEQQADQGGRGAPPRSDPDRTNEAGGRVVILALVFALFAHGCLVAATSLSMDPF